MIEYDVQKIPAKIAKEYIKENHYSKGCHNGPSPCFGLYDKDELIGVLMFATPCSENVRSSIFGKEYKDSVIELHRLHIKDVTPKNTESWFISRCLKMLKNIKPNIDAVISFSDTTENHHGTIYRATNFMFCGTTGKSTFYIDSNNRLRHPRQCGVNISKDEAKKKGWKSVKRDSKYRYVILLPNDRRHKKILKDRFRLNEMPYPIN